jgi:hypothetical protein
MCSTHVVIMCCMVLQGCAAELNFWMPHLQVAFGRLTCRSMQREGDAVSCGAECLQRAAKTGPGFKGAEAGQHGQRLWTWWFLLGVHSAAIACQLVESFDHVVYVLTGDCIGSLCWCWACLCGNLGQLCPPRGLLQSTLRVQRPKGPRYIAQYSDRGGID